MHTLFKSVFFCSISLLQKQAKRRTLQKPLTPATVEGESEDTRDICATVTTLCVTRDVSTKAGSGQVTDQMHSDPFLN